MASGIPSLEGKIVTFEICKFGDFHYDTKGTVLSKNLNVKLGDKIEKLCVSFKIGKAVHEGSFGAVSIVVSEGSRQFVVKAVRSDIEFCQWFFKQPKELSKPDFVPIVPLLAAGRITCSDKETYCAILMEKAEQSYSEKMHFISGTDRPLWMLRACESIIRACIFMRSRGVVNRDIHPSNLLIFGDYVLLCDGSFADCAFKYPDPEKMFQEDLRRAGTAILPGLQNYDTKVDKNAFKYYCRNLNDEEVDFLHRLSTGGNLDAAECLKTAMALRAKREPPGSPHPPPAMLDYADFWTKLIGINPKPESLRLDGSQIPFDFPPMFQQPSAALSQPQHPQNNKNRLIPDNSQQMPRAPSPLLPQAGPRFSRRTEDDDDDDDESDLLVIPHRLTKPQIAVKAAASSSRNPDSQLKGIANPSHSTRFPGDAGSGKPMARKFVAGGSKDGDSASARKFAARLDKPVGSNLAPESSSSPAIPRPVAHRPRAQGGVSSEPQLPQTAAAQQVQDHEADQSDEHRDHTYLGWRLSKNPNDYLIRKRKGPLSQKDCDELMLKLLQEDSEQEVARKVKREINDPDDKNRRYQPFLNDTILACWRAIKNHRATGCEKCKNN